MHKSSTITQCKEIFDQLKEDCFIPTTEHTYNYNAVCRIELPKLKKAAKKIVLEEVTAAANTKAAEAPFQGELLTLLREEESDITWKSLIYPVPRGVMAFGLGCACLYQKLAHPLQPGQVGEIVRWMAATIFRH